MNSSDVCHQVSDCPGLFVDAFRGRFLHEHTKNPNATFVLSHYHGDHYQQLPRDNKYKGPAKIHCTPVTARLLIDVHIVPENLVVEHEYGTTFRHRIILEDEKTEEKDVDCSGVYADITFYDANHCPGACIILIELPDGKTTHLHTGDMRYHPRFQSYPLLTKSTKKRALDLVYLDTTYCHPKHDFLSQEEAIKSIASQTRELLSPNSQPNGNQETLVLLSCYSIGKEKVLYEASKRSKQLIYVSEKKWKMLECIQEVRSARENEGEMDIEIPKELGASSMAQAEHNNILKRCTRDPSASDLHVIPMGLAGEMWPYFQPNFQKIAKYVEDISFTEPTKNETDPAIDEGRSLRKKYKKVVAFIPTGWADASNWNKKMAITTKKVQLSVSWSLHVEVRLVSYSEHSTFPELVSFIQYLKPRKIIPTVYSDQSHKRQIEGRFRNMLDSTRAKQAFFRAMTKKKNTILPAPAVVRDRENVESPVFGGPDHSENSVNRLKLKEEKFDPRTQFDAKNKLILNDKSEIRAYRDSNMSAEDFEEIEVLQVVQADSTSSSCSLTAASYRKQIVEEKKVDTIVSMGFNRGHAEIALEKCNGDVQRAIMELLSEGNQTNGKSTPNSCQKQEKAKAVHPPRSTASKRRKISDFFVKKKK